MARDVSAVVPQQHRPVIYINDADVHVAVVVVIAEGAAPPRKAEAPQTHFQAYVAKLSVGPVLEELRRLPIANVFE